MTGRLTNSLLLVALLACGREVVFVDPPPSATGDADTTGTDTTTVQRVTLIVTVTVAAADAPVAARIGLSQGRLAGARVSARRLEGQQGLQVGTTDSLGQVTLPDLIPGTWAVTVLRPLSEAERAALDPADQDVTGFGGAGRFVVQGRAPQVTIEAVAGRQGTLVISEAYLPVDNAVTGYQLGQYVEVLNNSFDTLFLDGKMFGLAMAFVTDGSSFRCSTSVRWREDPEGIWTRYFWAFPGAGQDYPLSPGGSVVIATDAIDHRAISATLLDLSFADFEFLGSNDVDNPRVPNMLNFPGWSDPGILIGHGPWWISQISIFLAERFNPDSLPRDNLPVQSPLYVRVPREKILDVLTSGSTPETKIGASYCANFVHPSFDGRFAELVDGSMALSLTRSPLEGSPPGLRRLQRTKVSAIDFIRQAPSPGNVP